MEEPLDVLLSCFRVLRDFTSSLEGIPWVTAVSHNLTVGAANAADIARRCFEFVRDEIRHSLDYPQKPVTCRASDVLVYRTGFCYAKSHLLAALLRANAIPAALCYQRLSRVNFGRPSYLHGLNAVWLEEYGWCRIDASGDKSGLDAQFCPPVERLAFQLKSKKVDLPGIYAEPLPEVAQVLTTYATVEEVYENLLDIVSIMTV